MANFIPSQCSLELAQSDYRLFRSMQNVLNNARLVLIKGCKNHLLQFFCSETI